MRLHLLWIVMRATIRLLWMMKMQKKHLLSLHGVHIVIRVMPFGLKNAGATYMRAMTTMFHDMMHREIEVYVDDVIIKSKK